MGSTRYAIVGSGLQSQTYSAAYAFRHLIAVSPYMDATFIVTLWLRILERNPLKRLWSVGDSSEAQTALKVINQASLRSLYHKCLHSKLDVQRNKATLKRTWRSRRPTLLLSPQKSWPMTTLRSRKLKGKKAAAVTAAKVVLITSREMVIRRSSRQTSFWWLSNLMMTISLTKYCSKSFLRRSNFTKI